MKRTENKNKRKLSSLEQQESGEEQKDEEFAAPPPLLFRKLSNPDLSPAATSATKSKLHRQLSQDENRARRSSLAMTGKQLLPLSCSLHGGVSQLLGPPAGPGAPAGPAGGGGDGNNLVRMRSQVLGQSAPSLSGLSLQADSAFSYHLCHRGGRVLGALSSSSSAAALHLRSNR
ncbi:microtubule-associated serine/threonine-protein kinase 2-like isoform X2 [Poecilia latipinna]|uniref:microtubule-associated serine/threonine-protein kinase 2-like isoform X2 n=1 Tax=Poecilia latipinna TaxID=48699 RepID=UPI00072E09C1|nr:PREDICTED: microtubule-associated serine/threonine-protein kinase 2-like isoform X2 [Poecilia latipinna]